MQIRKLMPAVGQFFLVFAFLCAPIADQLHSMKMLQNGQPDLHGNPSPPAMPMAMAEHAPCHPSMTAPVRTGDTALAESVKPVADHRCCPDKDCSPNNCLVPLAMNTMPAIELLPHLAIDARAFPETRMPAASIPVAERLRPPIA